MAQDKDKLLTPVEIEGRLLDSSEEKIAIVPHESNSFKNEFI